MTTQAKHTLEETCTWIVPSNVQMMMTGVKYAKKFASGRIELTYTDDTTESARCKETDNLDPQSDFFSIVSAVQSRRTTIPTTTFWNADPID